MPGGKQQQIRLETPPTGFLGVDTASDPTALDMARSRRLFNAYQGRLRSLTKRPGSVPVSSNAVAEIRHLMGIPFSNNAKVVAPPSLSGVYDVGSALPTGAYYYVKYTFLTAYGETDASPEANFYLPPAQANPTSFPSIFNTTVSGSTIPAGTYYVAYTWKTAVGETLVSPVQSLAVTEGNSLYVSLPGRPSYVTNTRIYIGTSAGDLHLQADITDSTRIFSTPIDTGAAFPPVSNTTKPTLKVTLPALPIHVTGAKIYISASPNQERLQGSTTTTTYVQTAPLSTTSVTVPAKNTASVAPELTVTAGDTLYAFLGGTLQPATMTNALRSADIYDANFTNSQLVNVKAMADGGNLKQYDGTEVKDIPAHANDPSPAPANALADVNAKGIKYIWIHNDHIFMSPGTNEVFYTKRYEFDYVPETQFFLLVRNGDYVNGPGIQFDNVCFIPMRRSWNIVTGTNFDDFDASQYLNTINGCIAPRSIQKITYATGLQTITYLSDDGVNEIYTTVIDGTGRQYATRNIMQGKIDFASIGFTGDEMSEAVSAYISQWSMYMIRIVRNGTPYVLGYDTRNSEWYIWTGLQINSFVEYEGVVYYGGNDGKLKKFDSSLNSDWNDAAKTTGTPVDFDRISGMISFEESGFPSTLDSYLVRLKTYAEKASLDISIVYLSGTEELEKLPASYMIWDESEWGGAVWANLAYSDLVGAPQRLTWALGLPKKGHYFQIRWQNNRDEPCEIYGEAFIGRSSGEM